MSFQMSEMSRPFLGVPFLVGLSGAVFEKCVSWAPWHYTHPPHCFNEDFFNKNGSRFAIKTHKTKFLRIMSGFAYHSNLDSKNQLGRSLDWDSFAHDSQKFKSIIHTYMDSRF